MLAVNTLRAVIFIVALLLSAMLFIISYLQFSEKGFLFNNSYIYASKEERNKMNKAPYYKQSAITFAVMGILFLMGALTIITSWEWLFPVIVGSSLLLIIYAIASSAAIAAKYK